MLMQHGMHEVRIVKCEADDDDHGGGGLYLPVNA